VLGTVDWMRSEQASPDRDDRAATAAPVPRRRRAPNRPLQAICTLILALAAAVAVSLEGVPLGVTTARQAAKLNTPAAIGVGHLITVCGTVVFLVFALISTFAFARWARSMLERFIGAAYGAIVRYVMILIGICVVLLTGLSMLGFRIGQLLVGGAVTGVLITIAAQQSLSNLFAGVMLQFAHPFKVGDLVRIRAGALGGTIDGTVTEFSITYVRLQTEDGPVYLPNAEVLSAAVTPLRTAPEPDQTAASAMPTAQGMAALAQGMAALAEDMAVVAQATSTPQDGTGQRPHDCSGAQPHDGSGAPPHDGTGQRPHDAGSAAQSAQGGTGGLDEANGSR